MPTSSALRPARRSHPSGPELAGTADVAQETFLSLRRSGARYDSTGEAGTVKGQMRLGMRKLRLSLGALAGSTP